MAGDDGRRIANLHLFGRPRFFFATAARAQEFVDVVLARPGEHALPTYVSAEFRVQITPQLDLNFVGWRKIRVSAFRGKGMMPRAVPKQSSFTEPGACGN